MQVIAISGRQLIHNRNYFRKKFKQTKDQGDWEMYKHLRHQVTKALRETKVEHFKEVCSDVGKNPWRAWNQLNSLMEKKGTKGVDILVKDNLIRGMTKALLMLSIITLRQP